jgi:hypothetical protein
MKKKATKSFVTAAETIGDLRFFLLKTQLKQAGRGRYSAKRSDIAKMFSGERDYVPYLCEGKGNSLFRRPYEAWVRRGVNFIKIGCTLFVGTNFTRLKRWALAGKKARS